MKTGETDKENIANKITSKTVLFFDLDGTLVDTNYANFLAYTKAIQSVTKSYDTLTYNPSNRFNRSSLKIAVPNLTESEYKKIIHKKEKYFPDFLQNANICEETTEILLKYSKTNKTVLVSNCRKDRAITILNYFGLANKFSDIFCREIENNDITINKFQNAISKLGVHPNFVMAFENELSEIENAQKEGIFIINPKFL